MTKVYPKADASNKTDEITAASVLTVWKKSLLLSCDGFTVFNGHGEIVFRVDNYLAGHRCRILLMDASGKPLFTIRRKKMNIVGGLWHSWAVYEGESTSNIRFKYRMQRNLLNSSRKKLGECVGEGRRYEIQGSYTDRCCVVYDESMKAVAEIKPKGALFGPDVFRLFVQPQMDSAVAMALVIMLDHIFPSSQ